MTVKDFTALEIEMLGKCEPLKVMLQPYAINVAGSILIETPVKKTFQVITLLFLPNIGMNLQMLNDSLSSIFFEWESHMDGVILQVEPPIGEIGTVPQIFIN